MVTWSYGDVDARDARPGAQINFLTRATNLISGGGLTGVVAATVAAPWGPDDSVVRVDSLGEYERIFTQDADVLADFNGHFIVREIFAGGAKSVLVKRIVNTGATATATIRAHPELDAVTPKVDVDAIELTAKYKGTLGNNMVVTISDNPVNDSYKDMNLVIQDLTLREIVNITITQTTPIEHTGGLTIFVNDINDGPMGEYVTAVLLGTAPTTPTMEDSVLAFARGLDSAALSSGDYTAAMDLISQEKFESVYFDIDPGETANSTILTTIKGWVVSERARGNKIVWYTGSKKGGSVAEANAMALGYDSEGIVVVSTGFATRTDRGGRVTYGGWLLAPRIAGLIAGLRLNESPTFRSLGAGIIDLESRHKNSDVKLLLESGVMPVVYDGARYKIERGVNSYSSFTVDKGDIFSKMQPLRILDNLNNVIQSTVDDFIIGKSPNSDAGRRNSLAIVNSLLAKQVLDGYIEEDFIVRTDPNIQSSGDDYFVQIGINPIEAIEFMWFNINLR